MIAKLKIGILGSGQVAKVLGAGFVKYGHHVMVGTRDANKLAEWKSNLGQANAEIGSFADAIAFGDIILLAVKGVYAEDLTRQYASSLRGKIILDATNPIEESAPENGVLRFFTKQNESLMERLQEAAPEAHFVKAFNSIGSGLMIDPIFEEGKPTMFIAGNNPPSKTIAIEILTQFGWDVTDLGKAEAARPIESLCVLWCLPGFTQNNWKHAIKFLNK